MSIMRVGRSRVTFWQAVEVTVFMKDEDGKESSIVMVERAISP